MRRLSFFQFNLIKTSITLLFINSVATDSLAAISQQPLLTRSMSVYPNLLLIFDNSGSMDASYLYQYGSLDSYGMGNLGPKAYRPMPDYTDAPPSDTPYYFSSDVNRLYYNPRVQYKARIDASGNVLSFNKPDINTFAVYFYKRTNSSTQSSLWDNTSGTNNAARTSGFFTPNYRPSASELAPGALLISYPNIVGDSTSRYPKWINRTDCAGNFCTWSEEYKNYSIWSAFHTTRAAMVKTGMGFAFKDFGSTLRVGWSTIGTLGSSSRYAQLDSGVSLFDSTTKANFYTWLYNTPITGSTPNLTALNNAGKYFSRTDSDGPWGTTPSPFSTGISNASSVVSKEPISSQLSCRRSYDLLVTDGYYNDSISGIDNVDGSMGSAIKLSNGSTWTYDPNNYPLFRDSYPNTMADIAMSYWRRDLCPDLPNDVTSTVNDESQWKNVRLYGINLGIYGTLPNLQATLDAITTGTKKWPQPAMNGPSAMDDMYHATANGHGRLLDATNTDALESVMTGMLSAINKITSSISGVAVSTVSLQSGTRKYTPRYTTSSWIGNVIAKNLDPITGSEIGTAWQVETDSTTSKLPSGIPTAAVRKILVGTANSGVTKAVPFTLSNMDSAGLSAYLDVSIRNDDAINYLRGDDSLEQPKGAYRSRLKRLGDIVNSTPVFIKGAPGRENTDPQRVDSTKLMAVQTSLPGTGQPYIDYMATLSKRPEGALFVGANDGMLHAIRDGTPSEPTTGGQEFFAYVPFGVLSNLYLLTTSDYDHRYFVDGPSVETDGYWDDTWHEMLISTTGAGAKSIFAMDVTNPLSMDASKVQWEITPASAGMRNLGYSLWDVQTGVLNNGQWAAIVGNGYESTTGTASLMILNMQTGALIREISTGVGSWITSVNGVCTKYKNALGGVALVRDPVNYQRIVGAYAGDLKGNVWRFDLSNTDPSAWKTSLLFNTGVSNVSATLPTGIPQPITAPPVWVSNPIGGRIVIVGTGKFIEDSDLQAPYFSQTIYGLVDATAFDGSEPRLVLRSGLVQRVLSSLPSDSSWLQLTDTAGNAPSVIDWTKNTGWYINLPFNGQRMVYPMEKLINRNSRVLVIDTISPANVSVTPCRQSGSGAGWTMFLDGLYGADPGRSPDVNKKVLPDSSVIPPPTSAPANTFVMGLTTSADGRNTTLKVDGQTSNTSTAFVTLSGGASGSIQTSIYCVLLGTCAPSSIPLKTFKRRVVTPLFLRM